APSAPVAPSGPGTYATASVGSIGVSDLAPPTGAKAAAGSSAPVASSAPAGTPFKPATLSPAAGTTPTTQQNPWTGKPREVNLSTQAADDQSFNLRPQTKNAAKEQMVSEVKSPSQDAVSKLDSIIGNEGGASKLETGSKPAAKADSGSFMWPVNSKKVISTFGPKGSGKANDGVNIASANGEPVWAAADGEVVYVGNELKGYGNMVLIKHSGDKSTTYAHLSRSAVDKYDRVKQGDIIGYVGSTGNVKEAQLHFAVRDGKSPVDPVKFLKQNVASLR
ncbi:MAG: peptidoglycan DD-metalloendopeptidase family protein, partial [Rickettsiales bacterium]|nr:peptidoglycan DD-metalloendopeptidase family protein [Rickettsiales bacterium]